MFNLDNGLTMIKNQYSCVNRVNVSLFFKIGSLHEPKDLYGITHLTEHMFFRRLNHLSQQDLYYKTECLGTTLRGGTYSHCVCFDMTISKIFFKEAVSILSELLQVFAWEEEDFQQEKNVVANQIRFKSKSFSDYVSELYFDDERASYPIMGTLSDLENIKVEDINRWKASYFTCDNACMIFSGCFEEEDYQAVLPILSSIHNRGRQLKAVHWLPTDYKQRTHLSDHILTDDYDDESTDVWITFDVDNIDTEEYYAARFLASILGFGYGSTLSVKIREIDHLTDDISASILDDHGNSHIIIESSCLYENTKRILEAIFACIKQLKTEITQRQYNANIHFLTTNQFFFYDDPRDFSHYLGWNRFVAEYESWSVESEAEKYQALSIPQLISYANKIFTAENMTINFYNNSKVEKTEEMITFVKKLRSQL